MPNRSVSFQVPGMSQPNSNLCWWTSFKMLTLYHRNRGVSSSRIRNIEGHTNAQAIYDQNDGTSTDEIEEIARDLGFSTHAASVTGNGLLDLLDRHGPIMYCGYWASNPNSGHCVVIVGSDGIRISINDPWYGPQSVAYEKMAGDILINDTALVYYNNGNR